MGQTETVLLPCHRADWVVLWRIRICGFTSFYIQEERDTQMFPASLVMVVFWRLSFSKCTYRDLSERGRYF